MKNFVYFLALVWLVAAWDPDNLTNVEVNGTPFKKGQMVTLSASMGHDADSRENGPQRVSGKDNGKILRDGNLVIIRDGVDYNVIGQQL